MHPQFKGESFLFRITAGFDWKCYRNFFQLKILDHPSRNKPHRTQLSQYKLASEQIIASKK